MTEQGDVCRPYARRSCIAQGQFYSELAAEISASAISNYGAFVGYDQVADDSQPQGKALRRHGLGRPRPDEQVEDIKQHLAGC